MIGCIKRLVKSESGVTGIEYGLIAAGIGVAILTKHHRRVAEFALHNGLQRPQHGC